MSVSFGPPPAVHRGRAGQFNPDAPQLEWMDFLANCRFDGQYIVYAKDGNEVRYSRGTMIGFGSLGRVYVFNIYNGTGSPGTYVPRKICAKVYAAVLLGGAYIYPDGVRDDLAGMRMVNALRGTGVVDNIVAGIEQPYGMSERVVMQYFDKTLDVYVREDGPTVEGVLGMVQVLVEQCIRTLGTDFRMIDIKAVNVGVGIPTASNTEVGVYFIDFGQFRSIDVQEFDGTFPHPTYAYAYGDEVVKQARRPPLRGNAASGPAPAAGPLRGAFLRKGRGGGVRLRRTLGLRPRAFGAAVTN